MKVKFYYLNKIETLPDSAVKTLTANKRKENREIVGEVEKLRINKINIEKSNT